MRQTLPTHPLVATFSIVGRDARTGDLGVAVQSKFLAVGAVVPWARAGVGAVATQALANTDYGPQGLSLLAAGLPPATVLARMMEADDLATQRQVGIVDAQGAHATYTGSDCFDWAGGQSGPDFAAQGNILAGPAVVAALAEVFVANARLPLWDRLLLALTAAQAAGGDRRGRQSAALLVVRAGGGYAGHNDRFIDLRVDDHPDPIPELIRLLDLHKLYLFPSDPADLRPITTELASEIQTRLIATGDLASPPSGQWDAATQRAMEAFVGRENLEERWKHPGQIDQVVLDFLRRAR